MQPALTEKLLADGVPVRFLALGSSMEPAIPGGTEVTVEPLAPGARIPPGTVVLARMEGRLVLHRAVAPEGDPVHLQGDAQVFCDPPIPRTDVLGTVPTAPAPRRDRRLRSLLRWLWEGWTTPTSPALERRLVEHLRRAAPIPWTTPSEHFPNGASVLVLGPGAASWDAEALEPPGGGLWDAVILTPRFYSLLPLASRRIALLKALRSRLRPGGTLHLQVLAARAGSRREALLEAGRRLLPGVWERGDRLSPYAAGTGLGGDWIFFHAFAPGEAERELARAGFSPPRHCGGWLVVTASGTGAPGPHASGTGRPARA